MDELVELTILYDFYSGMLTEKQRTIFELYYMDNLSLQEIANIKGVTKASVYDIINRTKANINEYEQRLGLVQKFKAEQVRIQKLQNNIKSTIVNNDIDDNIKNVFSDVLDFLDEVQI